MSDFSKTMETPSLNDLIDFDTFASTMGTAPLDDLHKYIDSDDEHDLEDNYAGESDDDDNSLNDSDKENDTTDQDDPFDHYRDSHDFKSYQPHFDSDTDSDSDISSTTHENVNDHGQPTNNTITFDPRLDIDRSLLRPTHAKSHHLDPRLQRLIDETEFTLEQLSIQAQPILEEQPMSTNIILANQAVEKVFKPYGVHGSESRFAESVLEFLGGGEEVRKPGREGRQKGGRGKLRFAAVDPVGAGNGEGKGRRERLKRGVDGRGDDEEGSVGNVGWGRVKIKMAKARVGGDVGVFGKKNKENEERTEDANGFSRRVGYGLQPATNMSFEGPQASADALSFRKTSGPLDLEEARNGDASTPTATLPKTNLYLDDFETIKLKPRAPSSQLNNTSTTSTPSTRTPFTPLATSFSDTLRLNTPDTSPFTSTFDFPPSIPTFPPTPPQSTSNSPNHAHSYSCTHSPTENALLASEPYNPISLKFSWPATTRSDGRPCMPTPGLLDRLNNILHLTNAEGRFMLSYYVRKYEGPAHLGGPGSVGGQGGQGIGIQGNAGIEPPHALFRLGIAQYLMSKVGKVIDNKESDELGLNPEARRVLGEVWERHPSTQEWFDGGLLDEDDEVDREDDEGPSGVGDDEIMVDSDPDFVIHGDRGSVDGSAEHVEDIDVDIDPPTSQPSNNDPASPPSSQRSSTTPRPTRNPTIGGLNPVEKALLARACNISVETVEAYWDDMRWKTRAWGAMKSWCTAQDKIRIARVKGEVRW